MGIVQGKKRKVNLFVQFKSIWFENIQLGSISIFNERPESNSGSKKKIMRRNWEKK